MVCWKNHHGIPVKTTPGLVHLAGLESQTLRQGASPWLPAGVAHPTARSLRQRRAPQVAEILQGITRVFPCFSYFSVDFIHLYTIDLNVKDGFRL